ncbi:PadR family transcriptional regulator [Tunicatimonas pelagia]|uniref:PadR family transcriptional regulator n=1 Tax=Tunicatimonas pelagia TaxID=931531 RepID=UPI0026659289|nr:helix-turn-helix transcriptional regulator [Tunicatimonas pelagia]WKN45523.1 helix-turn-helix transcriptional regulator [Tunicatimonas pelagia]
MSKQHLGELEELILLLIIMLEPEDTYGLEIRRALKEHASRTITIGAVHGTVNRLEKKGLVTSQLGGATDERGGRRKRLFTITAHGKRVLQQSRDVKVSLWQQIPELALGNLRIT